MSRCCRPCPAQEPLRSSSRAQQRGGAGGRADVERAGRLLLHLCLPLERAGVKSNLQPGGGRWGAQGTACAGAGRCRARMLGVSCLPALAEADVSPEQRWLLQDVPPSAVSSWLGLGGPGSAGALPEVLPRHGVPCPGIVIPALAWCPLPRHGVPCTGMVSPAPGCCLLCWDAFPCTRMLSPALGWCPQPLDAVPCPEMLSPALGYCPLRWDAVPEMLSPALGWCPLPQDGVPCPEMLSPALGWCSLPSGGTLGVKGTWWPLPGTACRVVLWMEESMMLPAAMVFSRPHIWIFLMFPVKTARCALQHRQMQLELTRALSCLCFATSGHCSPSPAPGLGVPLPASQRAALCCNEECSAVRRGSSCSPRPATESWD